MVGKVWIDTALPFCIPPLLVGYAELGGGRKKKGRNSPLEERERERDTPAKKGRYCVRKNCWVFSRSIAVYDIANFLVGAIVLEKCFLPTTRNFWQESFAFANVSFF